MGLQKQQQRAAAKTSFAAANLRQSVLTTRQALFVRFRSLPKTFGTRVFQPSAVLALARLLEAEHARLW